MIRHLSIRIDNMLLHQLHLLASCEGRSVNKEILHLIRRTIAHYEKKDGELLPQLPQK